MYPYDKDITYILGMEDYLFTEKWQGYQYHDYNYFTPGLNKFQYKLNGRNYSSLFNKCEYRIFKAQDLDIDEE
jgi:hypothetical protein